MGAVPPAPPPQPAPGLAMSANDIIASSLRLINAIAVGETPTAQEQSDALMVLNEMLDVWQAERLMIYAQQRQVFGLTIGQQAYQMGTGAPDFNISRPASIDYYGIIINSGTSQPLELPLWVYTESDWQEIPVKSIQSSMPQGVWDDDGFPWRTLTFWPVPNASGVQVAIYNGVLLSQFTDATTKLQFPPAYLKCIRYNLAVDLAGEFPGQLTQAIVSQAASAKAIIKTQNLKPLPMRCDPMLVSPRGAYYNWKTDNANFRG